VASHELSERFTISDLDAKRLLGEVTLRDPEGTPPPFIQDSEALIRDALDATGLPHLAAHDVLRALDIPAARLTRPFAGIEILLGTLKEAGLRVVVLTNAYFRSGTGVLRDARELGFGHWIDDVVSSVDTGVRKPSPLMIERGLAAARSRAANAVMIGDSEEKDIVPAKQLGMTAIRVAIEGAAPAHSRADAVVTTLAQAASVVRRWLR
jgi:FMN phosphatase YigB (HAD superfamily)